VIQTEEKRRQTVGEKNRLLCKMDMIGGNMESAVVW
jgi:hypothetical protein